MTRDTESTNLTRQTGRRAAAFTLLEVLVVTGVVAVSLGIVTLAFRKLGDTNKLTLAAQTLSNAAAIARAYAMDHDIETMLVVNPQNGRLEIWHANPTLAGGPWDIMSPGPPGPINGYLFAPVLDSSIALPVDGEGRSIVVVNPLDFDAVVDGGGTRLRDTAPSQVNSDNLSWSAVCFDPDGKLVQRSRRIATRLTTDYTGAPFAMPNRRTDGTPDIAAPGYAVNNTDSLITSARGFILSDRAKFEEVLATQFPLPLDVVNVWLARTRFYEPFVRRLVLSTWSGRELVVAE